MIRLGVNIDHIATVRQARGEIYPDPVDAGLMCLRSGADNLTFHLREDRRHIQDRDVEMLAALRPGPLNFELAFSNSIIELALRVKPHSVTFVPEKRDELTTEGGLSFERRIGVFSKHVSTFKQANILTSLFIEPSRPAVEASVQCGADAVEFHTGAFCRQLRASRSTQQTKSIVDIFRSACDFAKEKGLQVHVGHGLNYSNAFYLQHIKSIEEANIGHAIISRALFTGLTEAVSKMKSLLSDPVFKPFL